MAEINENLEIKYAEPPNNKWLYVLKPLLSAPGHETSMWGQILEKPDTILIFTEWKDQPWYNSFRDSKEYTDVYWPALSIVDVPSVQTAFYPSIANLHHLIPMFKYFTIITCYFPSSISEERIRQISSGKFSGLHMKSRGGKSGLSNVHVDRPHYHMPARMWALDPEERSGLQMKALLWLHFWKDPESEEQFMRRKRSVGVYGDESLPVKEEFEQRLRRHECQEIVEEHIYLVGINLGDV